MDTIFLTLQTKISKALIFLKLDDKSIESLKFIIVFYHTEYFRIFENHTINRPMFLPI